MDVDDKDSRRMCKKKAKSRYFYDHHPSSSTVGARDTVLGVGEATADREYGEATAGLE